MVDAGKVEFGIAAADEVVLARDRGTDIVAVFATYQTNPQGIMVHASRGLHSLADVFAVGGTLAVEPGVAYTKFFEKHYDLAKMKIVPYGYSIAPFLGDPTLAQQVFVTAEPIAATRQGADPQVFLIAESGFNPYAAVVITTGSARTRATTKRVVDFVAALREGWRGYLDDPSPANALMGQLNKEMDAETFRLGAARAAAADRGRVREAIRRRRDVARALDDARQPAPGTRPDRRGARAAGLFRAGRSAREPTRAAALTRAPIEDEGDSPGPRKSAARNAAARPPSGNPVSRRRRCATSPGTARRRRAVASGTCAMQPRERRS